MVRLQVTLLMLIFVTLVKNGHGHGYLAEPAGRSSMWRVPKFRGRVIPNYTDMGLRCGGSRSTCGVCGDPVEGPYENEAGGKFASGIIAAEYVEGQTIKVTIDVTANHEGWFQFHLCPNNDFSKRVTEECLMRNVLQLSTGGTKYYLAADQYGKTHMYVNLPEGVICSQCVFRWKWITEITGLEQFYGCADISISPRNGSVPTISPHTARPTLPQTEVPPTEAPITEAPITEAPITEAPITEAPITEAPFTEAPITEAPITEAPITEAPITEALITEAPVTEAPITEAPVTEAPQTEAPITEAPNTEQPNTEQPITEQPITKAPLTEGKTWKPFVNGVRVRLVCHGVGVWNHNMEMDEWCNNNCNNYEYNCPTELCECSNIM